MDMTLFGGWVAAWLCIKIVEFFAASKRQTQPSQDMMHVVEVLAKISSSLENVTRMLDNIANRLDRIDRR